MATCQLCTKRILSHAYKITCANCRETMHLNCLRFTSKEDATCSTFVSNEWFCPVCIKENIPFANITCEDEYMSTILDLNASYSAVSLNLLENQHLIFNLSEVNDDSYAHLNDIDAICLNQNFCFST